MLCAGDAGTSSSGHSAASRSVRGCYLVPIALKTAGHAYHFQQRPTKAKQDPMIKVQGLAFLFLLLS